MYLIMTNLKRMMFVALSNPSLLSFSPSAGNNWPDLPQCFGAPSPALTMETLHSCLTASVSKLVPSGCMVPVFPGHSDIEGLAREVELEESEHCDQGDLSLREGSDQNKKKKKNKANKI